MIGEHTTEATLRVKDLITDAVKEKQVKYHVDYKISDNFCRPIFSFSSMQNCFVYITHYEKIDCLKNLELLSFLLKLLLYSYQ